LQETLCRIININNLEKEVDRCFPPAALHWFRFWMTSPLSPESAGVLHQILAAMKDEDSKWWAESGERDQPWQDSDLERFLEALRRVSDEGLKLHVYLSPSGHADCGWTTVFSHCPRCKAEAPVKRWSWKRESSVETLVCLICGQVYSPASTRSRTRWPQTPDLRGLREILGQEAFEKFATRYLTARGLHENEASGIVGAHEDWHRNQEERFAREREIAKRPAIYLEEVVYKGLKKQADEDCDDWFFSEEDFHTLLKRCENLMVRVQKVFHRSTAADKNRFVGVGTTTTSIGTPMVILDRLKTEGCHELFGAHIVVPEDVVNRWWNDRKL
jgi:Zn ribbon nucleic-acid-binding protein